MLSRKIVTLLILVFSVSISKAQIDYSKDQKKWVDSVYQTLDLDEKIGQLFMLRAYSKNDANETAKILSIIQKHKIGGLCFFQGNPEEQINVTNLYQANSDIPLLMAIDGEWGLGMRFPSDAISFPRQLALGAIQDQNKIYEMGREIALHCKKMGIHVNFGPVVDVNNNVNNPVINDRSFGEDKFNVSSRAYTYIKGMQDEGVIACAKHFPGHGDTDVDSHLDLPIIRHSKERLYDIELFPFKNLSKKGVESMMVAHLNVPAFDDRKNRPTTLSRNVVNGILREEFDYNGLVFTDALDMKGVSKFFPSGLAEAEALLAGNDVLLLSEDVEKGIIAIKKYITEGKISEKQLNESVKRILKAKAKTGAYKREKLDPEAILEFINRPKAQSIKSSLIEESLTLVNNKNGNIPISDVNGKMATLAFGVNGKTKFHERLDSYAKFNHYYYKNKLVGKEKNGLIRNLKYYNKIIVSFNDMSKYASKDFGIKKEYLDFLKLLPEDRLIIVLFGSPYSLKFFDDETILVAYSDDEMTQDITAQALFGVSNIRGKLPVTASVKYKLGDGIYSAAIGRIGYCPPEKVGMNSKVLDEIGNIANEMISRRAAPGCQVVVAKDGYIVYEKAYGNFEYNQNHHVSVSDIYDMASVTKILASTIGVMKLESEGKINIDLPIKSYVPEADTSNKANISLRAMMTHHGRLKPWIPFYRSTVSDNKRYPKPLDNYYASTLSSLFSIPVSKKLFLRSDFRDSIWSQILGSELRDSSDYRYSDLGFYFACKSVENITGQPFNKYLDENFYSPMGLFRTGFKPLERFPESIIAPSENDNYFRLQKLQGTVHDMGAAMLGGVSGHAGLFSNGREIAILMQMLLNKGYYGGQQYISKEVVKKYTSRYAGSTRRGIGFDMKELDTLKTLNMCEEASDNTFGHLGFTGTVTFADPDRGLIYVFLSNRTFPSMDNKTFNRLDIRPRIQSKIYESMGIHKERA
jgi:beta-glucosidase-like glycosyl hydrolase/CubicO group peptidase (beta-lactamase class C family)